MRGCCKKNCGGKRQTDWVITVKKCDAGASDAFVWYTITDSNGSRLAAGGEPKNIGDGKYVASIPTNLKPPLDNNKIVNAAEAIAGMLGSVCNALDYWTLVGGMPQPALVTMVCPAIGAALTTVTGPGGPAIATACAVVATAIVTYCSTVGYDGPPEAVQANHDSFVTKIINDLKDPAVMPNVIRLTASASTHGISGYDSSSPLDVTASGPFPPTTISVTVPDWYCDSLLDGTWSGTWNIVGKWNGCTYFDGGDITITLAHDVNQTISYSGKVVSATGIHSLYGTDTPEHPKCSLAHIETSSGGSATAKRTGDSVNLAFALPVSDGSQEYTGTLQLSSVSNDNKTLSGHIHSSWSTGYITLTNK